MLIKLALSALITAAFGYLFFVNWPGDDALSALSSVTLNAAAVCFLLYLPAPLIRALRLMRASGLPGGSYLTCLRITVVHNFLNSLMPMRLGELSIPVMLRRNFNQPLASGGAVLVVIRMIDLWTVLMGALVAVILIRPAASPGFEHEAALPFIVVISLALLFSMPWVARWGAGRLPSGGSAAVKQGTFTQKALSALSDAMTTVQAIKPARLIELISLTVLGWAAICGLAWYAAQIAGVAIDPIVAVGAVAAVTLSFLLPVSGVANFGPFEIAWIFLLQFAGYSHHEGFTSALTFHALVLASGTVALALALFDLGARRMKGPGT